MITDEELLNLAPDLESDRVERKESLANAESREKIAQAVCAFANDLPNHGLPGLVLIGLKDSGDCAGTAITEQVLQTLADLKANGNILPPPSIDVEKRTIEGCEVAVAQVYPAMAPPVRLKGSVWVRVGPRRSIATPDDERRLNERRRSSDVPFELQSCPGTSLDDLDLEYFGQSYLPQAVSSEVLAANERSTQHQLVSLKFVSHPDLSVPTVLGLLTLGKVPQDHVGGAYIHPVRFAGRELTDPVIEDQQITGRIVDVLNRLDDLLRVNIHTSVTIGDTLTDVRRPDYPLVALQQIARNAVLHRLYEHTNTPVRVYWYEDRVEVISPGGPYGNVTPENFGEPGQTSYRNLHLAGVMRALGYVQHFGVGIPLAQKAMRSNGNPEIEFKVSPTFVHVTLRSAG